MARSVKLDSRYAFIAITDQRQNERQTKLFCRSGERRLRAESDHAMSNDAVRSGPILGRVVPHSNPDR